jgi:hypothetical protein
VLPPDFLHPKNAQWQKRFGYDSLDAEGVYLMARRRIKFKLGEIKISGIELEIEDERESATAALNTLQSQLTGAFQPALSKALLGAGAPVIDAPVNGQASLDATAPQKRTRRRAASSAAPKPVNEAVPEQAVAFVHDPDKFGNPSQQWNTANKAIWLLWVVEQATEQKELTAPQIADVFNRHYREFGTILSFNISRDLGNQRKKSPAPVGTDPNRNPQVWFLYDAGKAHAQRLAKGWDGKSK